MPSLSLAPLPPVFLFSKHFKSRLNHYLFARMMLDAIQAQSSELCCRETLKLRTLSFKTLREKKKKKSNPSTAILRHYELSAISSCLVNKPSKTVACSAFVLFYAKERRHLHTCVMCARDETTGSRAKKTLSQPVPTAAVTAQS